MDSGLADKDVDKLAEAYDTTIDVIEEDLKRFKALGYTKEFLGVTNQYRNMLYLNHEALLTSISYDFRAVEQAFEEEMTIRSRVAGSSSGVSVNLYREFWLAFFRNAIAVPFDDFTY